MFFGQKVHRDGPKLGHKINSPNLLLGHKSKKYSLGSHHNHEEEAKERERQEKRQNHSYLERYV
jgi:hypothetical protein